MALSVSSRWKTSSKSSLESECSPTKHPCRAANTDREIIDESDVFVDVHKAIRRMAPAPRTRIAKVKTADISRKSSELPFLETDSEQNGDAQRKLSLQDYGNSPPKPATFMLRRRSSGTKDATSPYRSDDADILQHLKHLGPSNAANKPKSTRSKTVKIKPGHVVTPAPAIPATIHETSQSPVVSRDSHAPEGGIGQGLLSSAGREASDGVQAVGYGTMAPNDDRVSWKSGKSGLRIEEGATSPKSQANGANTNQRSQSTSTIGSLHSRKSRSRSPPRKRHTARSGSITENIVDVNGVKKIVLETTSSSDSDDKLGSQPDGSENQAANSDAESTNADGKSGGRRKRKKRGKKNKKGNVGSGSETQPLLRNR